MTPSRNGGVGRRRVLVLNQYYWPGVEATAQLLTELCEALAQDIDVKVVTGVLHGHEDEPRHVVQNGVTIVRVPSAAAAAASATLSSIDNGPSSMPGNRWKWISA